MDKEKLKRYFQLMLVVVAAGSIYPLIYLRTGYQETILQVFGIELSQLNNLYTALGFTFVIGYFPSGWISDKFSAKWLLTLSLFFTSLGGFWFAQIPSYSSMVVIFVIWGFFSVFTFWSAHMKMVKLLSTPAEEGRFFGILDGGRGLIEAILAAIAVIIFATIMARTGGEAGREDPRAALQGVIYMYAIALFVVAVLIAIFVKEDKEGAKAIVREKVQIKGNIQVFKNKLVYLVGAIIFMGYFVTWAQFFMGGFLESSIGVSAVSVATVMMVFLWMRPIGGMLGGFLADKIGKSTVVGGSMALASICLILLAIIPRTANVGIFFVIVVAAGIFIFCIRGTYWSLLGDVRVDNKNIGLTIGYISLFGYLPDILAPQMSNLAFGAMGGHNAYFIMTAILGIIGVFICFFFKKVSKKTDGELPVNN
ncbi:MAG: MFS transporter [Treponema sp.]|nr:MFS transporter [Treponema sp.]